MDNFLDNGAILPFGLLGHNQQAMMEGFNKTYRNYPMRMGVVVAGYPTNDDNNHSKLSTEYDVWVFEQNEDRGSAPVRYKNCLNAERLGSKADFLEWTLRVRQESPLKQPLDTKNQNGAVVLLLCLDAVSEKGVIICSLTHPDRQTTITDAGPHFEGEFNGVHVVINSDGSVGFTVKGATDNDGNPIGGTETVTVGVDSGKNVTIGGPGNFTLNITGNVALTSTGNTTVSCADATVTATGTATIEGTNVKLGAAASESVIKGDTFKKYFDMHIHPTALGPSEKPLQPMPASTLSTKVKTE